MPIGVGSEPLTGSSDQAGMRPARRSRRHSELTVEWPARWEASFESLCKLEGAVPPPPATGSFGAGGCSGLQGGPLDVLRTKPGDAWPLPASHLGLRAHGRAHEERGPEGLGTRSCSCQAVTQRWGPGPPSCVRPTALGFSPAVAGRKSAGRLSVLLLRRARPPCFPRGGLGRDWSPKVPRALGGQGSPLDGALCWLGRGDEGPAGSACTTETHRLASWRPAAQACGARLLSPLLAFNTAVPCLPRPSLRARPHPA